MPYGITGNAQQIFYAFKQNWDIAEEIIHNEAMHLNCSNPRFLGTPEQALRYFDIWNAGALKQLDLKEGMPEENLHYLLGLKLLMKKDDSIAGTPHVVHQHFSYVNDAGSSCRLVVMYRKDNLKCWFMGLIKNEQNKAKNKQMALLSSIDLTSLISVTKPQLVVENVGFLDNEFMQQIDADLPRSLIEQVVDLKTDKINVHIQRIQLMTRPLNMEQKNVILPDPIPFSDMNLSALFADNPALDLIIQYDLTNLLSSAVLFDFLSDSSSLRRELEAITLTEDDVHNKNLLNVVVVFHKHGLLDKNKSSFQYQEIINTFRDFMGEEMQIKLIPFLREQQYSDSLMRLILSNPAYFRALNMLIELNPALTSEVPQFFKDSKKRDDLVFIDSLLHKDSKQLCLVFWVKDMLSKEDYQEIVAATHQYPLLAPTLIALDKNGTKSTKALRQLALNPQGHLKTSIRHHFREKLETSPDALANISKFSLQDLDIASNALILLKKSNITDSKAYHLVLDQGNEGHALRLFLPQLAKIESQEQCKLLIDILLTGVKYGIQSQGKEMLAIKNSGHAGLVKHFRERFICVRLMQDLKFEQHIIEFTAQEHSEEARRFRQVILQVEEQCKIIHERLSSSSVHRDNILSRWNQEEKAYRRTLYQIAYNKLTQANFNLRAELQDAENKILAIVDPTINSFIHRAITLFSNIIITALSLCIANVIKYKATGNFWFFNHTPSGEELRVLHKAVCEVIEPEQKTGEGYK